jgi:hypothetical protein
MRGDPGAPGAVIPTTGEETWKILSEGSSEPRVYLWSRAKVKWAISDHKRLKPTHELAGQCEPAGRS